jgi:hypothetical protein
MGLLDKLGSLGKLATSFIPGADTIVGLIDKALPDKMSEKERADITMAMQKLEFDQKIALQDSWNKESNSFRDFTNQHEGSASDLIQLGFAGKILLGLRGIQRPIWGFGTLFIDYKVFSGLWLVPDPTMMTIIYAINLIVLSFLFGERAIKNVMPLVETAIRAYTGNNTDGTSSKNNTTSAI